MSNAIVLARAQFAFTVGLHIVLPAFSIGLASYLAVLEALWLWTGRQVYLDVFNYWLKIFAVGFAMGVVSGVVMSYQFGTNWARFSDKAGPVIGPLMGYEVLTAFFLEAGFLGVMLFGLQRVGPTAAFRGHLLRRRRDVAERILDSGGQFLDANAGRVHHRAGWTLHAGGLVADYLQSLISLSFRAYGARLLSIGGLPGGRRGSLAPAARPRKCQAARVMFSMAMWMAAIVAPCQLLAGDQHGPEHARIPAGQNRRHGRRFRDAARHAALPVRHAQTKSGADRLRRSPSRMPAR